MVSKLESLRSMTTVVSDTGDMESIKQFKPTDATTNPTLILKASQLPAYAHLVDEAVSWGARRGAPAHAVTDRLAVNFGAELTKIVPGRVSTEVDADLSFDTAGSIAKAKALIADYESRGVGREHILIKLASTWEGAQADARLALTQEVDKIARRDVDGVGAEHRILLSRGCKIDHLERETVRLIKSELLNDV